MFKGIFYKIMFSLSLPSVNIISIWKTIFSLSLPSVNIISIYKSQIFFLNWNFLIKGSIDFRRSTLNPLLLLDLQASYHLILGPHESGHNLLIHCRLQFNHDSTLTTKCIWRVNWGRSTTVCRIYKIQLSLLGLSTKKPVCHKGSMCHFQRALLD